MHPRGSGGHSWEPHPPPKWPEGPEIIDEVSGKKKKYYDAIIHERLCVKSYMKGFLTASIVIILLHMGLAYYFVLT